MFFASTRRALIARERSERTHPRRSQQPGLVSACREMGVVVTAWSPLGKGAANLLTHPTLATVAANHPDGAEGHRSKTAADVALRWGWGGGGGGAPRPAHAFTTAGTHRLTDPSLESVPCFYFFQTSALTGSTCTALAFKRVHLMGQPVPVTTWRWNVQRGVVVIPKSTSRSHLTRNLSAVRG